MRVQRRDAVSEVKVTASAWVVVEPPGFHLAGELEGSQAVWNVLTIPDIRTPIWISPTAFGIAIDGTAGKPKRELHGQVVVPVRVQGPTILQALTFVPSSPCVARRRRSALFGLRPIAHQAGKYLAIRGEPTPGLEPGRPSLRVKSRALSAGGETWRGVALLAGF